VKPEFLEDMRITKIAVTEEKKGTTVLYTDVTYPNGVYHDQSMKFDDDGNYTIQWATYNDENNFWEALYSNNSVVTLWVTAEVNEYITKADAELGRIKRNTAKVTWYTSGTPDNPYLKGGSIDGEADIDMTNIVGFRKVNQDGEPLSGAEFQISGVTVNDVKPVYGTDDLEELQGVYIIQKTPQVKSTVNGSLGGGVQTDDAELFTFKTNEDGYLILVGLSSEYSDVVFTEVKAPDGYNKLTESKTFPIIKGTTLSAEFVTLNVDMDPGKECYHTTYPTQTGNGNHWVRAMQYLESADNLEAAIDDYGYTVINKKGILLPATGGMGVTALYVIGGLMIVGAGTALVVRRRRKL
jgi:LPXTG-motif cell wall-anchored protein